jgi:hypothetical protein
MTLLIRRAAGILTLLLIVLLAGCGSGGSGPATGEVVVTVTDGPTDVYERVLITLKRMTLIGSGGHKVIYEGVPLTFDLLQLRDRADFAFSQTITAGQYSKIRLEVTEVRLVDLMDPANPDDDVEVVLDKLAANGKIDLNPQGPFNVTAGRTTVIELDIDARRSFQVVNTGTGELKLRPVIFTNIYEGDVILPSRFLRVFGTLAAVNSGDESLKICEPRFVARLGGPAAITTDACVQVYAAGANHFGIDGMSVTFQDIIDAFNDANSMSETLEITAIGFASLPDGGAPADIALNLDAVVDELGPRDSGVLDHWETTIGTLKSDCVALPCAPVNFLPRDAGAEITVQLQPATRVFRRDGTELAQTDLMTDETGAFDALRVDNGGTEELKASLFVFGHDPGTVDVSGTLTGVDIGELHDILTVQPAGVGLPVTVCVNADTDVVHILINDESVSIADLLDPAVLDPSAGLLIDAAGDMGTNGCDIDANVVIVEEPGAVIAL